MGAGRLNVGSGISQYFFRICALVSYRLLECLSAWPSASEGEPLNTHVLHLMHFIFSLVKWQSKSLGAYCKMLTTFIRRLPFPHRLLAAQWPTFIALHHSTLTHLISRISPLTRYEIVSKACNGRVSLCLPQIRRRTQESKGF